MATEDKVSYKELLYNNETPKPRVLTLKRAWHSALNHEHAGTQPYDHIGDASTLRYAEHEAQGIPATDRISAYKFIDKRFKLLYADASDELLRNTFDVKMEPETQKTTVEIAAAAVQPTLGPNVRFKKKPYLNPHNFVYTPKDNHSTDAYKAAYSHLVKNERYDAKLYIDREFLEDNDINILNKIIDIPRRLEEAGIKGVVGEVNDELVAAYKGVYSNLMFINFYHLFTDYLYGDFTKTEDGNYYINNAGWWWHQAHERIYYPETEIQYETEDNIFAEKIFYHNFSELEDVTSMETHTRKVQSYIASIFQKDLYYNNPDNPKEATSYSGIDYSFNSGLYDTNYATKQWMGAKGNRVETTEVTSIYGETVVALTELKPFIYCETSTAKIIAPKLYMVFNYVPVQMKCNKVAERTYIYSWPEYLLKNIEALSGCDYIMLDTTDKEKVDDDYTFYSGKINDFYRPDITSYENDLASTHTINYINTVLKYEALV